MSVTAERLQKKKEYEKGAKSSYYSVDKDKILKYRTRIWGVTSQRDTYWL